MDRPILHPLVAELRESDRLRAFAEALPAAARVSEPALPLLLAALHEELGRGLVLLAPEDADARDAAERAARADPGRAGRRGLARVSDRGARARRLRARRARGRARPVCSARGPR